MITNFLNFLFVCIETNKIIKKIFFQIHYTLLKVTPSENTNGIYKTFYLFQIKITLYIANLKYYW